jgi:hypothetical protein
VAVDCKNYKFLKFGAFSFHLVYNQELELFAALILECLDGFSSWLEITEVVLSPDFTWVTQVLKGTHLVCALRCKKKWVPENRLCHRELCGKLQKT